MKHLRILDQLVHLNRLIARAAKDIGRHDKDLARQMRRAAVSAASNAAEGAYNRGANRNNQLTLAMCSGRELVIQLRIAGACGYLENQRAEKLASLADGCVAQLYRLMKASTR